MSNRGEQQVNDFELGDPLGQWQETPQDWTKKTLWELAQYINGRAFKPSDFSPTGLRIIKITELKYGISAATSHYDGDYEEKHALQNGDLLFAWSGNPETSLDIFWWGDGKALLNQHIFRLVPGQGIDKQYLFYLLKFLRSTFIGTARDKATSMGHVKISDLKRLVAYIPPPDEQQAIAQLLSPLDDKIELNRRMNETLEAIARAIFKSWFVDFDPVRAKMGGRQPFGMDLETAALFPDSFQPSSLGNIPKKWLPSKWGELVTLEYGKSLSGYEGRQGAYPVYGTNGQIGTCSEPLCKHPGIIIGRKGAYRGVHFCKSPFFAIDTAFYIEPKASLEMRWAYYEMLLQDLNSMDSGSAIPSTSREDFYMLPVVVPRLEIQQRFVQLLTPCWDRQERNEQESRTLAAARDALLPKLISGEIRVKDAEKLASSIP